MGWSATRVHVRSDDLAQVAESFRTILHADGARPASVDEHDSGVERYQVLRQVGSPWVTIARWFLDVEATVADQLSRQLNTTALSLVVYNSDAAFLRIIEPVAPKLTVEFPARKAKRSEASQSLRTIIDNRISDEALLALLAERPIGVEMVLGPLLLHADLPESQSIDFVEDQQMEIVEVCVRRKDAPTYELATGGPIIGGYSNVQITAISGWPIDPLRAGFGFANQGGPFSQVQLEFVDDGRPVVAISTVCVSAQNGDEISGPDVVASFAESMTIAFDGAAATVERFPTSTSTTPTHFTAQFEGTAVAPGSATVSVKVSLDGGMRLPFAVKITVLDEQEVPLPLVRTRVFPVGADYLRRLPEGPDIAGLYVLNRRLEADELLPILNRWMDIPAVGDGPFYTFAVNGVRSLRRREIGKSKKWKLVAEAVASMTSFTLGPLQRIRPFTDFSLMQPRSDDDPFGSIHIASANDDSAQLSAIRSGLSDFGDLLAGQGLLSQGSVYAPKPLPYLSLVGWNGIPPGRDPSRDLIVEPAPVMWLTPDVVAKADRPLGEIGTLEPVGTLVRFVAHDSDIRTIERAVESLLPPVQLPGN